MSQKRLTNHNARSGKYGTFSPKHNDRSFNTKNSQHINSSKTHENLTWHCYPDENLSFEEVERKFYEENFTEFLDAKNEMYIRGRHKEKVRTMDDLRSDPMNCPEETIIMIGKKDDSLDRDRLWAIFLDQMKWEADTFPNVKMLNAALHVDESGAPHIHQRKVWTAFDKNGMLHVSQNKALKEMGVKCPNTEKGENKWNNAKMTYSKIVREHFIELCQSNGIDIIVTPKEASQTGLTQTEYKNQQEKQKLEAVEKKLSETTEELKKAIEERDMAIEEKVIYKADTESKIEQLSDIVDNYLNVSKKKKLFKEDTFEMSQEEYKKFELDKLKIAENAQIILDAENINKKREEVLAVRREYTKYKNLKDAEEAEHRILSEKLPAMRAECDELQQYISKNIPEKIKSLEQNSRLSLLETIVADAGKALKGLDRFLDEHTNIQYHSKIREMVRTISRILSKASDTKQGLMTLNDDATYERYH